MIRLLTLIALASFLVPRVEAQNIFVNDDFELNTGCPTNYGQTNLLNNWDQTSQSSDYYDCAFNNGGWAFPTGNPYSGSGFIGFANFTGNSESVGQQLGTALVAGQSYRIVFHAMRASGGTWGNFCGNLNVVGLMNNAPFNGLSVGCPFAMYTPNSVTLVSIPFNNVLTTGHSRFDVTFTPSANITALIFTADCNSTCNSYFFVDCVWVQTSNVTPSTGCITILSEAPIWFDGVRAEATRVDLSWLAGAEHEDVSYALERSIDGQIYEAIYGGTYDARDLADGRIFGFADHDAPAQTAYYRLRHTDANGETVFSNVVTALPFSDGNSGPVVSELYPTRIDRNDGRVNLRILRDAQIEIGLYDIKGTKIWSDRGEVARGPAEFTLPTQTLAAGMYLLRTTDLTTGHLSNFRVQVY